MEFEQIIKIIETVSNSSLTSFHYEAANGEKIDIDRAAGAAPAAVPAVSAGTETSAAAVSAAAGTSAATVVSAGAPAAVSAVSAANAETGAAASAAVTPAAGEADLADNLKEGNMVKSPLVGTFYAAPAEDAEPYVKVGDHVKKGQTLGIVEAMKLMNEIESDYDGVVTAILVQNGDTVEYGMPLFCIA